MSKPTLLLVHGWGLGAGSWRPLLNTLGNPPHQALDFGFYGKKNTTITTDQPFIAVGHSIGFLWLLHHMANEPWAEQVQGLISINGFSCFARKDDFPNGVNKCLLRRMKNGLQRDPVQVLDDFRELSGGIENFSFSEKAKQNIDALALAYGLGWLLTWDERPFLEQWKKPLLVIANRDDKVVTPAMTIDSFASVFGTAQNRINWLSGGEHLGLLHDPEPYGELIRGFL